MGWFKGGVREGCTTNLSSRRQDMMVHDPFTMALTLPEMLDLPPQISCVDCMMQSRVILISNLGLLRETWDVQHVHEP